MKTHDTLYSAHIRRRNEQNDIAKHLLCLYVVMTAGWEITQLATSNRRLGREGLS
jgi:hypothetical protein